MYTFMRRTYSEYNQRVLNYRKIWKSIPLYFCREYQSAVIYEFVCRVDHQVAAVSDELCVTDCLTLSKVTRFGFEGNKNIIAATHDHAEFSGQLACSFSKTVLGR